MSSRTAILQRVKDALSTPAPLHGHPPGSAEPGGHGSPKEWLPAVGESFEEQVALFARNAEGLKAVFQRCPNPGAAQAALKEIATRQSWKRIASHKNPLNQEAAEALGLPVLWVDGGYDVAGLESCDAGITGCDALIAQTGSVLVSSPSAGGRALSVLPPHHIVLARESQLLPDLPSAFALIEERYGKSPDGYPSFLSFITGPSRTGDIERILVLGAHGPKELTILLLP